MPLLQGTKVYLNVYDLAPANDFLYNVGLGLHHSGIEILGTEYSFASGAGIFDSAPKEVPNAQFRESILMGVYEGSSSDVRNVVSDLRSEWSGDSYNLILKNCNHFANALCWALLNKTIPGYVNRLADLGGCCKCLIPNHLLTNAPVGDTAQGGAGSADSGGLSSQSGFQVYGRPGSNVMKRASASPTVFSGKGATLGSASTPSSSDSSGIGGKIMGAFTSSSSRSSAGTTENDWTDRRERARKAALARFEQSQQMNSNVNQNSNSSSDDGHASLKKS